MLLLSPPFHAGTLRLLPAVDSRMPQLSHSQVLVKRGERAVLISSWFCCQSDAACATRKQSKDEARGFPQQKEKGRVDRGQLQRESASIRAGGHDFG